MSTVLRYRGREVTEREVAFIRERIAASPNQSRRALSLEICAAWGWVQPNGVARDAVCRGLLLALHRAGHITLPAPQWTGSRRHGRSVSPVDAPSLFPLEPQPVRCAFRDLGPILFRQVRRSEQELLFNRLIGEHHYLGYSQPVGEHLKFLISSGGRPLACFLWTSAPRHLGPRDRFIGWSPEMRRRNISLVAYNSRFLILPRVEVPHLASHLLGRMVRMLPGEWMKLYHHPVCLAETFVDTTRWRGTCYRAANWIRVGETTGRGKDDQTRRPNRTRKDVLVYPLTRSFRAELTREEGP